jgi:hypothetical protein
MVVAFDHPCAESALKEVAGPLVAAVESLRVQAVEPVHSAGEIRS